MINTLKARKALQIAAAYLHTVAKDFAVLKTFHLIETVLGGSFEDTGQLTDSATIRGTLYATEQALSGYSAPAASEARIAIREVLNEDEADKAEHANMMPPGAPFDRGLVRRALAAAGDFLNRRGLNIELEKEISGAASGLDRYSVRELDALHYASVLERAYQYLAGYAGARSTIDLLGAAKATFAPALPAPMPGNLAGNSERRIMELLDELDRGIIEGYTDAQKQGARQKISQIRGLVRGLQLARAMDMPGFRMGVDVGAGRDFSAVARNIVEPGKGGLKIVAQTPEQARLADAYRLLGHIVTALKGKIKTPADKANRTRIIKACAEGLTKIVAEAVQIAGEKAHLGLCLDEVNEYAGRLKRQLQSSEEIGRKVAEANFRSDKEARGLRRIITNVERLVKEGITPVVIMGGDGAVMDAEAAEGLKRALAAREHTLMEIYALVRVLTGIGTDERDRWINANLEHVVNGVAPAALSVNEGQLFPRPGLPYGMKE